MYSVVFYITSLVLSCVPSTHNKRISCCIVLKMFFRMFDAQTEAASLEAEQSVTMFLIRRRRVLNDDNITVDRPSRRPVHLPSTPASATTINTWAQHFHF